MTSPQQLHAARPMSALIKGVVLLTVLGAVGWIGYRVFVKGDSADSMLDQAAGLEKLGSKEQALSLYEKILTLDPRNIKAKEAIDRIKAEMAAGRSRKDSRTNAAAGESSPAPSGGSMGGH